MALVHDGGILTVNVFKDLRGGRLRRDRRGRQGRGGRRPGGQLGAGHDAGPEFRQRNALFGVAREDPSQNIIELIRHGQDRFEESRVPAKGSVGRVVERGLFPGVASTG